MRFFVCFLCCISLIACGSTPPVTVTFNPEPDTSLRMTVSNAQHLIVEEDAPYSSVYRSTLNHSFSDQYYREVRFDVAEPAAADTFMLSLTTETAVVTTSEDSNYAMVNDRLFTHHLAKVKDINRLPEKFRFLAYSLNQPFTKTYDIDGTLLEIGGYAELAQQAMQQEDISQDYDVDLIHGLLLESDISFKLLDLSYLQRSLSEGTTWTTFQTFIILGIELHYEEVFEVKRVDASEIVLNYVGQLTLSAEEAEPYTADLAYTLEVEAITLDAITFKQRGSYTIDRATGFPLSGQRTTDLNIALTVGCEIECTANLIYLDRIDFTILP